MLRFAQTLLALMLCFGVMACDAPATSPQKPPAEVDTSNLDTQEAGDEVSRNVAALTAGILALSDQIDPEEAARAARIAYAHTAELKVQYQITDGPLAHNIKVNNGTKPRGLCWHWAEDMEKRLKAENFQTLQLHRAIANYDNWRLEHSTAIISLRGASMYQGMVLDPWRKGGA